MPTMIKTDAKSLYDVAIRDTPRPQDKGLRVVVAQLGEMLACPGTTFLKWTDNSMILAEATTKDNTDAEYLMSSVDENHWSDELAQEANDIKDNLREGRRARAEAARDLKRHTQLNLELRV